MKDMKRLILVASLLLGCLISGTVAAQEAGNTISLSLEQAMEYAVEHSRTLANASLDIKKAEAARWQKIAAVLPQVKATADYSTNFGYVISLPQMSLAMPSSITGGVNSSIALNGQLFVSMKIADISKSMADINQKKTEKDIKYNVKTLYFSALVVEQTVDLLKSNFVQMQRLCDITNSSVKAGVAEQTDADQLEVQLATIESSVKAAERNLELAYNSIRLALCLDDGITILLTQKLEDLVDVSEINKVLNEQFVLERNYDYQLLEKTTEMTRKQVSLVGWANSPTLSVFHQYTNKKYLSNEITLNMTPPNMLGISLSLPIFTSGKNTAAYKEAKLAYQQQLNTMADTELSLRLQYRQYMFNLTSALERLDNQIRSVEVAQRVFDNISRKFENGMASSLEVTNAGTSLITSQQNYVQAVLEAVNAKISLEQLLNI